LKTKCLLLQASVLSLPSLQGLLSDRKPASAGKLELVFPEQFILPEKGPSVLTYEGPVCLGIREPEHSIQIISRCI
jgi:hypothetical protein